VAAGAAPPRGKRRGADAGEGADPAAEAAELVRFFLRKTSGGKERLVAVLDRHVKVVRTEHCFLLFEELGRRDGWVQCLEVSRDHTLLPHAATLFNCSHLLLCLSVDNTLLHSNWIAMTLTYVSLLKLDFT
jgi:hypothetical protein